MENCASRVHADCTKPYKQFCPLLRHLDRQSFYNKEDINKMAHIIERDVVPVIEDGGDSTGSNAIWAIAFLIIVAMIVGALCYSGALRRITSPAPAQKIDVEVQAPA